MGKAVTYNDLLACERRYVAATEALAEVRLKIGEVRGLFALSPDPSPELVIRKLQNADAIAARGLSEKQVSVPPSEGASE